MKCVNCGKRIVVKNEEIKLCKKCSSCTTLFDARIQRLKQKMYSAILKAAVIFLIATYVYFKMTIRNAYMIGMLMYYYSLASLLFPAATCLSEYVQLRKQVKKELEEEPEQ